LQANGRTGRLSHTYRAYAYVRTFVLVVHCYLSAIRVDRNVLARSGRKKTTGVKVKLNLHSASLGTSRTGCLALLVTTCMKVSDG
jgi:hypothetical protein